MSRSTALTNLNLASQDWGPCYADEWTHAEFSEKWRGTTACPSEAELLAAWEPAPAVPQSVTPFQASRALLQFGMLDAVEDAVAAADRETQLAWNKATTIERNSPFVASMASVLSLTDAQLDDLFILAASFV